MPSPGTAGDLPQAQLHSQAESLNTDVRVSTVFLIGDIIIISYIQQLAMRELLLRVEHFQH